MSLCPEADYRAGLSDDDFWAYVYRWSTGEGEPDDVAVDLDGTTNQTEPCPVCGEFGACSYDAEGRELVHVVPPEVDE